MSGSSDRSTGVRACAPRIAGRLSPTRALFRDMAQLPPFRRYPKLAVRGIGGDVSGFSRAFSDTALIEAKIVEEKARNTKQFQRFSD